MTHCNVISFYAPKGGVGCSTLAAAAATWLASQGKAVLLVDEVPHGDMAAVLGVADETTEFAYQRHVRDDFWLTNTRPSLTSEGAIDGWCVDDNLRSVRFTHMVIDYGGNVDAPARISVLVTRPCYLALRRAAICERTSVLVAVIEEPGRVLSTTDVGFSCRQPTLAVPYDSSISRCVDAGLLAHRMPMVLEPVVAELVERVLGSACA